MLLPLSILIYRIAIQCYYYAVCFSSIFNHKARLWLEGRNKKNYPSRNHQNNKSIWLHVASLGEYEQARPVIDALKKLYPEKPFVITFFSPSGYEIVKRKKHDCEIYYLPLDTKKNAAFIVDYIQPEIAIFVKYEFWYFTLQELYKQSIPVILIAAIFRKEQLFFKWYGLLHKSMLQCYKHVFVQDENSAQLLRNIGFSNITISGDTRFDRVIKIAEQQDKISLIEVFKNEKKILIAGSTWQPDEQLFISMLKAHETLLQAYKIIIAPHEINLQAIEKLQQQIPAASIAYSHLTEGNAAAHQVLIIDNIGLLSKLYSYAEIAYIGGGFGKGIHNILEAAVHGIPVAFGPHYKKFKEAKELIQLQAATSITTSHDLLKFIQETDTKNSTYYKHLLRPYFDKNKGATEKIVAYVQYWILK